MLKQAPGAVGSSGPVGAVMEDKLCFSGERHGRTAEQLLP